MLRTPNIVCDASTCTLVQFVEPSPLQLACNRRLIDLHFDPHLSFFFPDSVCAQYSADVDNAVAVNDEMEV